METTRSGATVQSLDESRYLEPDRIDVATRFTFPISVSVLNSLLTTQIYLCSHLGIDTQFRLLV